jgi:modulator of FtsH protease
MSNHPNPYTAPHRQHAATAVTGERAAQVLKNNYMLLGLSLMVATGAAVFAMAMGIGYVNVFVTLGVYFGLLFATNKLRNSSWGILAVFGLTGWLGFTTGPIINMYAQINGGMEIVSLALGGTASIFVAMSGIALVTRKDFSFMTNFIMVGILVAFLAGLAAVFFNIPALSLAVSAAFVLLSSLLILWQTSAIIHGGETNYIMATVTLFVSIYNLFLSLLHILTALSGND